MKYGNPLKQPVQSRNTFIKFYFIIGTIIIIVVFVLYLHSLFAQAKKDAQIVPNLFARFVSFSTMENFDALLLQYFFDEVVNKIDYPIIVTDSKKQPLYWKNIGVDENARFETLSLKDKVIITQFLNVMIYEETELPIRYGEKNSVLLGYAYYGQSPAIKKLKYMPYFEIILLIMFISFGIYALAFVKKTEKNVIWVGLAKETAHQFGTPISSLLGWLDMVKYKLESGNDSQEIIPMLDYMRGDVDQLQKVAFRFGKVGSSINLKSSRLDLVINETIVYFSKRLPQIGNKIELHFINKIENLEMNIDADLIKWSLENIIKNAADAMQMRGGNIIVTAFSKDRLVTILIKDEGKGMPKSMFKKIFEPGVTSKNRGWGLGLSLTKRIIEEFHHGKVKVIESTVNEGTTFEISLPYVRGKNDLN